MVQIEKHIMIWERRVELEREMQATLSSDADQEETNALHRDLHRMELKLSDLHRQQEMHIRVRSFFRFR